VRIPFTWKPTGWYMVGWSAEFREGEVRPLRYFGEDLVAYRDDRGVLHILAAHCLHLGAHIGHGGRVDGECVVCPFHGWGWGPDGINRYIPYEDRPNRSKHLRVWPVVEKHGCVFMWNQPQGQPPRWDMPDVFSSFPGTEQDPASYYRPYPELSVRYEREPVHPQVPAENAPDSIHFQYVHRASVTPRLLEWKIVEQEWRFLTGWPDERSDDPEDMSLRIHSILFGLGGAVSVFEGASNYRLVFATTPVDDSCSDMFYSIWWPRLPGDDSDVPPENLRKRVEKEFLVTLWDDLEIWRYQDYVENPALAKQDARPYKALRDWAKQFYEVEPSGSR
jgi:phenylpropionate dioxygenase-like ring-hydroxylating dioxygenase large terminal subunit